ncbi:hypothetical protein PUNSTDRAFT_127393 [Punctularia strigosozonata HHB-11173 SS5]|uniref:uncharacterized protein n=1 Tax=Punctularia strigosozonata (strain HHB-11173) TaxID=741275 RepID=UPI000441833B|nr:uncharacterized protein PUNSTDRAFT_127393 [Punctularia strigosozonata HHB-11173 SS5]EIN06767.1 hypothetical protein PUNSTDRAFT_127393 [Punctularia strigosozonata HHB-11173 SS5]
MWARMILTPFLFALAALAENTTDDSDVTWASDPMLRYRPPFIESLPVQILITGIIFALVAVLFAHLLFTCQYHWHLAPINYVLQLASVLSLLISLIACLRVVCQSTITESKKWPYMLSYIAVDLPPLDPNLTDPLWPKSELAAWYIMDATTSGLIQITHIQFLTLLYPSDLEKRLILGLLAPLALTSAVMEVLPIIDSAPVAGMAASVSNVCNATLSLLFTASLFLYGLLVNRSQAWRTDGGTAAFGAAALTLAVLSTFLTFLYIPSQDQYTWMQGLIWAVIMWQTFMGWWWWVGAGMGGEVQDMVEREERRRDRRRKRGERARRQRERAARVIRGVGDRLAWRGHVHIGRSHSTSSGPSGEVDVSAVASGVDTQLGSGAIKRGATPPRPGVHRTASASSVPTLASSSTDEEKLPARRAWPFDAWCARWRRAHMLAVRRRAEAEAPRLHQAYGYPPPAGWGPTPKQADGERGHVEIEIEMRAPGEREESAERREERERRQSMWWWGPLRRWRLQDSTRY